MVDLSFVMKMRTLVYVYLSQIFVGLIFVGLFLQETKDSLDSILSIFCLIYSSIF